MKRLLHIPFAIAMVSGSLPAVARDPIAEEHAVGVVEKFCLETDFSMDSIRAALASIQNKEEKVAENKLTATFNVHLGETEKASGSLVANWKANAPTSASLCSITLAGKINGELLMLAFFEKLNIDPSNFEEGKDGENLFTRGQFQLRGRNVVVTSIIVRKAGNYNNDTILLMFRPAEKVS
jgi:hypothetical protein